MKLLKKLSEDSNLVLFLIIFPLTLFLFSFILNVKDGSFYILSSRIPIAINKNFFTSINYYLLGFLITVTTYTTLIFYTSIKEKKSLLIFIFPIYLFFILYLSVFIAIGYVSFFKVFIYMYLNVLVIYSFLFILGKLFKSTTLAVLIILFIQLIGGGMQYLFEFSEMFQGGAQIAVKVVYSILPFYQKIQNIYQTNDFQFLYINIVVALLVISYEIYFNCKKN